MTSLDRHIEEFIGYLLGFGGFLIVMGASVYRYRYNTGYTSSIGALYMIGTLLTTIGFYLLSR
jgi:hypothetical protein